MCESVYDRIQALFPPFWAEETADSVYMIQVHCPDAGCDVYENEIMVPDDYDILEAAIRLLEEANPGKEYSDVRMIRWTKKFINVPIFFFLASVQQQWDVYVAKSVSKKRT